MAEDTPEHRNGDRLRSRNRELSILNTIAEALNGEVDLSQALNTTLEQVVALFNMQTGWIWLLHEDTGDPYLASVQNLPPVLADEPHRMAGTVYCHCLDTYQKGDLTTAANIEIITCTRLQNLVSGTGGLRYHASVPLNAHGKKLGMLNVLSSDWRELSSDDLRLLHTIGDLLAIAIERARLFRQSLELGAVEERYRLAREIHDTLAQGLVAIIFQLETADSLLESTGPDNHARAVVRRALQLTRQTLEEARRSVSDLRAAPLEGRNLEEALSSLVTELSTEHDMDGSFTVQDSRPLPPRLESGLYRIAQEALTNIARHAYAQRFSIQLNLRPDQAELVISDDGRGFDLNDVTKGRFGMIGLNERTRLLDGQIEIRSEPGSGTWIKVVIPMDVRR